MTEDIEKPGNLGAILRSADGAGADGLIAIGGTDLFNPNVIRASVGTMTVRGMKSSSVFVDARTEDSWRYSRTMAISANVLVLLSL